MVDADACRRLNISLHFKPHAESCTVPCDPWSTCSSDQQHAYASIHADFLWRSSLHQPLAAGSIMGGRGKEELKNEGGERTAGAKAEGIVSQTPTGV